MPEPVVADSAAPGVPGKRAIVEALVLAFSHSEAKEIVGTDALRMVLDARYVDMIKNNGSLDLQPLWQILESQPGFVPQAAVPPLCIVKQWEEKLGVQVVLPKHMETFGRHEVSFQSSKCKVPDTALQRALLAGTAAAQASTPTVAPPPTPPAVEEIRERGKLQKALIAAGIALLAAAGAVVYTFHSAVRTLDPKELSGEIPVAEARMMNDTVAFVLSDGKWISKPEADRTRQINQSVERLGQRGIIHLVIMDPSGRMILRADRGNGSPTITYVRK